VLCFDKVLKGLKSNDTHSRSLYMDILISVLKNFKALLTNNKNTTQKVQEILSIIVKFVKSDDEKVRKMSSKCIG